MPEVLLCCSVHQAHRGVLLAGILLCRLACQALKGAPWVGSYSVVQCIRHLMGQPLYCSAANAGVWGEFMVMVSPPTGDSAILSSFHGCLHWHFPPRSHPSHPFNPSLCSQQQPSPWDCSIIPKVQLPAAVPSRGPVFLSGGCMAAARAV